ncbi:MAG: FIMAH domain-containing protein [Actinomycetota bacterium]
MAGAIGSGVARSLEAKVDAAEASSDRDRPDAARYQLEAMLVELEAQRSKHVSESAYVQLKEAVEDLIATL